MVIPHSLRLRWREITKVISRSEAEKLKFVVRPFFALPNARWITVFIVVAGLYAANVIQWSIRFGRLAMDPVFDDVGYFIDGLQRLNILDRSGFHEFCQSFISSPPHSPWSTSLAILSFALMGVHDWAPYALNSLLVFLFLCVAWDLVGQGNAFRGAAITSIILLLQLPFQAVLEFRPDFAVALFTATFSLLILKMGCYEIETEIRNHFLLGLLAGLAYLTKPSFFPHTSIMVISAILIAETCRGLRSPARFEPWRIGQRLAAVLAGAILVSGCYFILTWRTEMDYFLSNTGSGKDAAIWKVKGGFWASLVGRLQGYSVRLTLGHFQKLLTGWLFFGLGFALFQRNYRATLFILGGTLLASISLLLISAGQMVDPHFSYTWTILVVLITLFAVSEMAKSRAGILLVIVFCLMSIYTFYKASPTGKIWLVINDTARGKSMNESIVERVAASANIDYAARTTIVYSTFMGKVNAASQSWLALSHNQNINFRDLHRSGDLLEHMTAIQNADFVEIADAGAEWLDRWLPSASLQRALLERVRSLAGFEELAPVVGKEGTVFLFKRRI
jgi:Dolichyl-phosphate-mannose-protein mannosyltransferase